MVAHLELPDDSCFLTCPKCSWKVCLIFLDPDNKEQAWSKKPDFVHCLNCGKLLQNSEGTKNETKTQKSQ